MTDEDLLTGFRNDGVIRLDGAFSVDEAQEMKSAIWRHIEQKSPLRLEDPSTWETTSISFKALKGKAVFAPLHDSPAVVHAFDVIFGSGGWARRKAPGAQILCTLPTAPPWIAPDGWHMDGGFERPTWPTFGVKLFSFFDDVEPEGGGTLLLAGSHRLVERYRVKLPANTPGNGVTWGRFMKQDPWLDQLRRGGTPEAPRRELLGAEHVVDGIPVRAIELAGRPGDVVIAHLHVFHSPSPNVSNKPRQMLGGAVLSVAVAREREPHRSPARQPEDGGRPDAP